MKKVHSYFMLQFNFTAGLTHLTLPGLFTVIKLYMTIDCFKIILKCRHSVTIHVRAKHYLLSMDGHGRRGGIYSTLEETFP